MKSLWIHPEKCTGCNQCELACSWVNTGAFDPARSVIRVHLFDEEAAYSPYTCLQCEEAWCMTACPVNAIAIHPGTEAKLVLDSVCVGCALCTIACPFGTMFFDPRSHKAAKCHLCGGDPACAHACPTAAIEWKEGDGTAWLAPWGDQVSRAGEASLLVAEEVRS